MTHFVWLALGTGLGLVAFWLLWLKLRPLPPLPPVPDNIKALYVPEQIQRAVLVLHGYTGSMAESTWRAQSLLNGGLSDTTAVFVAQGTIALGNDRFSWYNFSFDIFALSNYPRVRSAVAQLLNGVRALMLHLECADVPLHIVGNSQGGHMALNCALGQEAPDLSIPMTLATGGWWYEGDYGTERAALRPGVERVVNFHGTEDVVVNYARSRATLEAFAVLHDVPASFISKPTRHEVWPACRSELVALLNA